MKRNAAVVFGLLVGLSGTATAQLGLSVRAGSLGLGGELSFRPSRYWGLRLGGHYLSVKRSATIEGIAYDFKPQLQNGVAIVDLHPLGSSLHLSAGMVWNSNKGSVLAQLTGPVTIGTQTYQPAEIGSLTGLVNYKNRYAPYAGIGFGGRGRLSVLFDVGVVFSGYPQISLTGASSLTGQAKVVFDQNVRQEVQDIQTEIDSRKYLKYTPVVSLGLRVGL